MFSVFGRRSFHYFHLFKFYIAKVILFFEITKYFRLKNVNGLLINPHPTCVKMPSECMWQLVVLLQSICQLNKYLHIFIIVVNGLLIFIDIGLEILNPCLCVLVIDCGIIGNPVLCIGLAFEKDRLIVIIVPLGQPHMYLNLVISIAFIDVHALTDFLCLLVERIDETGVVYLSVKLGSHHRKVHVVHELHNRLADFDALIHLLDELFLCFVCSDNIVHIVYCFNLTMQSYI